jgi:hypothetical protein
MHLHLLHFGQSAALLGKFGERGEGFRTYSFSAIQQLQATAAQLIIESSEESANDTT